MILTRQLFRDTKTALMNITGHPGSARLGEALARGFGFDDLHDAKTTFDAEEAALDWLPQPAEFNEVPFMDFLDDTDDQVKADMAATALFLVFGGLPFEDIANYPVLTQGRVCLTGAVPDAWRTAAVTYLEDAFGVFKDQTIVYIQRPGHWSYIDDDDGGAGLEEATYEVITDGVQEDVHPDTWDAMDDFDRGGEDRPEAEDADDVLATDGIILAHHDNAWVQNGTYDFDKASRIGFQTFCDTAFLRVRDAIPDDMRQWVRHMEIDASGIRLVVAAGDVTNVPIWFVRV